MSQILMGGAGAINDSSYSSVTGWKTGDSTESGQQVFLPEAGNLLHWRAQMEVAAGVGRQRQFLVRKNAASTTHTATLVHPALSGEDATSAAFSAGDLISMLHFHNATNAMVDCQWAGVFTPSVTTTAIWGSFPTTTVNNATRFHCVGGHTSTDATDVLAALPWAIPGSMNTVRVKLSVAPGVGKSRQYQLYLNGVAQAASIITVSDANTTGSIGSLTIAFVPGDTWSLEEIPTGTPAAATLHYGVSYTPTVAGQWNISGYVDGNTADADSVSLIGGVVTSVVGTRADIGSQPHSASTLLAWNAFNLRVLLGTAPGASENRTYTIQQAGVSSTLAVTVSNNATSNSMVGSIVTASELVVLVNKTASSVSPGRAKWAMGAGTLPPASGGSGGNNKGGNGKGGGNGQGGGGTANQKFVATGRKRLRY